MSTPLAHLRILLGVTGGIAAYKACELTRLLHKAGAQVRVVMTPAAGHFVTPLSLQALSGHPVRSELFDAAAEAGMDHIELARWADAVLVAPATADFMARLAHGRADDLLTTLCLATEAPLFLAPSMNRVMWANPVTQANRMLLESRDIALLGPAEGEQACGETGEGRMREPAELASELGERLAAGPLAGCRVTITAGPTREPIDPVRVLSNRSSGRMGFAVAEAARAAGARVTLITGPVALPTPAGVERVDVETAAEMHAAVLARLASTDLFIGVAAVADYRPAEVMVHKLKKGAETLELRLTRTPDILAEVSAHRPRPFCVGFAAETESVVEHARAKLVAKQLDLIAANRVGDGLGLEVEDNALDVLWDGGQCRLERGPKTELARHLIQLIAKRYALARGAHSPSTKA
ncbi:phosphopantothenoylcysteine decarboxylase [Acidihalobacter yilgarnensis]|uniref:Coenzyme A biosynthesis bifunctional protein CoaBC n=1 Tax=Acidihalobacter yilgarnensis TaxID=2819280 RepID=A0A1D8ISF0_9GAMM|nr:bifunctional phosphopantothenoylcysteine decarboxylase/phosphopantothenate--cysteine ligase CoaBC [Acidihalobacter yilgarnensis]AOU99440.1 phosphopantothenoylcysteine decarboxylase [Acidihalobacter yilgarnensis]